MKLVIREMVHSVRGPRRAGASEVAAEAGDVVLKQRASLSSETDMVDAMLLLSRRDSSDVAHEFSVLVLK